MNLKKDNHKYELWNNSELLATNYNNTLPEIDLSLLSEADCKRIEWIDVEKLAMDKLKNKWSHLYQFGYPKKPYPTNYESDLNLVKVGIYEAQSLNDKMFSLEDMKNAFNEGWYCKSESKLDGKDTFIQSLQQTSWNVEVNESNQITKLL